MQESLKNSWIKIDWDLTIKLKNYKQKRRTHYKIRRIRRKIK
jgi:hypothetical protein